MPESFKKSFRAIVDGEWYRLDLPTELGGYGASPSLRWAAAELILGANPALFMYSGGPELRRRRAPATAPRCSSRWPRP